MAYLTQSGVFSYNGYSLQGPRNSVQVQVQPVYDSTGRRITHSRIIFAVEGWITSDTAGSSGGGADTATHMTQIRAAWTQSGGALVVTGWGFGDISVNTTASNKDVNFGPKPQPLEMRNIGSNCIFLTFVIEAEVKICSDGAVNSVIGRLKEFVYNIRWTIKPNGCTVRTVEGHLETFLNTNRVGSRRIDETADDYRELVQTPVPAGFYRSHPQEYKLSENKQRLYFKVQDEEPESDNAYPPGVTRIRLENNVTADFYARGFAMQEGSFSGEIEMAKSYGISLGWERALLIMKERIVSAFNNGAMPMITFVSLTESIFERRISFSVRYQLLASSLQQLITKSGLMTDVTSTNIRTYAQSMQLVWANRGLKRLQADPSNELLPDPCVANQQITIMDRVAEPFFTSGVGALLLVCPTGRYLTFQNLLGVEGTMANIAVTQMPTKPVSPGGDNSASLFGVVARNGETLGGRQKSSTTKYQSPGDGNFKKRIIVRGRSYRVGVAPEIPEISKIMGKDAGFVKSESRQEFTIQSYYGGVDCPIYAANWYHVYDVQFATDAEFQAALSGLGLNSVIYKTRSGDDPTKKTMNM